MKILIVDDEPMVLEETKDVIQGVCQDADIFCAGGGKKALKTAEENQIDIAFLDIEMPGMSGLELSQKLKEIYPDTNIIFVTTYSEYALEAFSLYASGYLMKPLQKKEVEEALYHLRHPVQQHEKHLKVQCFGNFEVFYDNKPVPFARAKAKEIFAYLIDLKGAAANTGELCAVLWEDSTEIEKNRHYLRNLLSDIRKALHACHADAVFISTRNQFAVNTDLLDCDYYQFLKGDPAAINSYRGEYMKQYSWAEFSLEYMKDRYS